MREVSPPVVTVGKLKLHGGRGCWQAYEVGRDDGCRWLFTPGGSRYRGSDEDADRALAAAARTERSLKRRTPPFDGRGDRILEQAGRQGLPPLVDVPHPFDI